MRIGIMGGTLDPVHNGHVMLAQMALKELQLDRVMLLPAGDPPHKSRTAPAADRMEMARLAVQDMDGVFACSMEIQRSGTTYTVDTLRRLQENNPQTEWIYIVGADTLNILDSWRCFEQVAQMCSFAVCARADETVDQARMEEMRSRYGARFAVLKTAGPEISSTQIRELVSAGGDIAALVPPAVEEYILKKGLYISPLRREEIIERLRTSLKPSRFEHTLGVAETAKRLTERFGISPALAEMAALLHDCAKYMPVDDMKTLVKDRIPDVDALELDNSSVLHAPAGAVLAQQVYEVKHPAILSAIRKHTLGDMDMSPLDALIYTADFIEPARKDFPGLAQARELAETDLYAAMCMCTELTNAYLKNQDKRPHPKSLAMLKHYQGNNKEEQK